MSGENAARAEGIFFYLEKIYVDIAEDDFKNINFVPCFTKKII